MAAPPRIAITIARQLGAGGAYLGQRVAARLGYTYLDREILRQAAKAVGAQEEDLSRWDEHISRFWDRLMDAFRAGPPELLMSPGPPAAVRDSRLFEVESRVIRAMAQRHDVVVIGRGGFHILRDQPGLVRVFLHAPPSVRASAMQKEYGLTEQQARQMIERVDSERDRFQREMCGCAMADALSYDLCLDTDRVGLKLAEQMILDLTGHVRQRLYPPQ